MMLNRRNYGDFIPGISRISGIVFDKYSGFNSPSTKRIIFWREALRQWVGFISDHQLILRSPKS
jgi:hypothetical protein